MVGDGSGFPNGRPRLRLLRSWGEIGVWIPTSGGYARLRRVGLDGDGWQRMPRRPPTWLSPQ